MSEEERKEKLWKCPVCGGSGKLSKRKKRGLQFYKSRCCQVYNTIWNPGFNRFSAFILILVGLIIIALFIKLFLIAIDTLSVAAQCQFDDYRGAELVPFLTGLALIIGASLIVYGITVFAGKAGTATIIQQGTKKE